MGVIKGQGCGGLFAIGEPGRAATELPSGPPPARVGPADIELSAASMPGVAIRAASSRGLQHRAAAQVRQDTFALGHHVDAGTEHAIAVVCDGVGSLYRSAEAAAAVSRGLAEAGAAGEAWPTAFGRVNEELRKAAEQAAEPRADGTPMLTMATTAVAVSVRRDGAAWIGDVAWVGDSTFWHLDDDGQWTLIAGASTTDEDNVYHSGRVSPMPSRDGACEHQAFRLDGGALFLMSDGVGTPLQWSREVRQTLASWWARPPDPFAFAAQAGFARRGEMDDRTVVGIWGEGIWGEDRNASREAEPWAAHATE
jgi:hypothetical protein